MLTDDQVNSVWQGMLAAETRSLYFADLGTRYTHNKQLITGVSFFLSSGAAALLIGKFPSTWAIWPSLVVAILNAYSIAVSLDRKISTMAQLYSAWSQIALDYQKLWNHPFDSGAEAVYDSIRQKEVGPSELSIREAPNNTALIEKWQKQVFILHDLTA